jgi:hypothetical protein
MAHMARRLQGSLETLDKTAGAGAGGAAGAALLHEQVSQPSDPFLNPFSQNILHDIVGFLLQSVVGGSLHAQVSQPSDPFLYPSSQNIAQAGLLLQGLAVVRLLSLQ